MPFIAINKDTSERVCILDIENPRKELKNGRYICQSCKQPMIVTGHFMRGEAHVRAHFRHKQACDGDYISQPESAEHLAIKEYIANNVHRWHDVERFSINVSYEYPIDMEWRDKGRIADLMVEFKDTGIKDVHEVQLSSITLKDLIARTEDYLRAGYFVWWYMGDKNDRPEIKRYLFDHQSRPFFVHAKNEHKATVNIS